MPRIGKFGKRSRVRTDIQATPSVGIQQAGMRGKAAAGLANQVGEFATQIGKQRALAARNDDELKVKTELAEMQKLNQDQNEVTANSERDFSGFANKLLETEDTEFKRILDKISPLSHGFLQREYDKQRISRSDNLTNLENKRTLQIQAQNESDLTKRQQALISQTRDPDLALAKHDEFVVRRTKSPQTFGGAKLAEMDASKSGFADNLVTAQIDASFEEMNVADAIINNKGQIGAKYRRLGDSLSPEKKRVLNSRIDAKRKAAAILYDKNVKNEADNHIKFMDQGGPEAMSAANRIENSKILDKIGTMNDPIKRQAALTDYVESSFTAMANHKFADSAPTAESIQKLMKEEIAALKKDNPKYATMMESVLKTKGEKIANDINTEMNKNGADFHKKRDFKVAELDQAILLGDDAVAGQAYSDLKDKLDAKYDRSGVPKENRTYLSSTVKNSLSSSLRQGIEGKSVDAVSAVLNKIEMMNGGTGDSYEVLKQVASEGKGIELVSAVGEFPDEFRRKHIANILNKAEIEKNFNPTSTKEINDKFSNLVIDNDLFKALASRAGGNSFSQSNARRIADLVTLDAKANRSNFQTDKEAITSAWSKMGGRYQVVRSTIGGTSALPTLLPTELPAGLTKEMISDWMFMQNQPEHLDELDLNHGKGLTLEDAKTWVKDTGSWALSVDGKSLELYASPNGIKGKVEDSAGNHISIDLREMKSAELSKEQKAVINARQHLRQRQ